MTIPVGALEICRELRRSGFEAWLVGGAVRDMLLGKEAHDFDIATNAKPWEVQGLFVRVIDTGLQHGTVTVIIRGGSYEVTTFRGDGIYTDGRHPDEVKFCSTIEEDLGRRDFTVNAIAYDPLTGTFADPYNGREDLANKVLRTVGNPNLRFSEDGLRVLRAARFAATLGFTLDSGTKEAIQPNLHTFSKVSPERVHDEWVKTMKAAKPSVAFRIMADTGMLEVVAPEFIPMIGCSQNKYHAFDVWEHTLAVVDALAPSDPILRLAGLFHDVGKPPTKKPHPVTGDGTFYDHENVGAEMTFTILSRLRFSAEDRDRVVHLVKHHFVRYETNWAASAVRRMIRKIGLANLPSICDLARADIAGKGPARVELEAEVIDHLEARVANMQITEVIPTSTKVLVINGSDIMKHLGIPPGPTVGRILNELLEAVTDNPEYNTVDKLLELARAAYGLP